MRRLREVSIEPQRNEGVCRALLRLDTCTDDIREVGNLIEQNRRRMHRIAYNSQDALVHFFDPLRGDEPIESRDLLYLHNSDDPSGTGTLVVNGLSLADLERDVDRFAMRSPANFYNSTLIKALTVDGFGGRIDWKNSHTFSAALLYYLENMYIRVPGLVLDRLGTVSETRMFREQTDLTAPQTHDLNTWYEKYYLPQVAASPTHRPFTETYFVQLREQGFPAGEEADLGEAFFTDYTYRKLKQKEQEILQYRQTA